MTYAVSASQHLCFLMWLAVIYADQPLQLPCSFCQILVSRVVDVLSGAFVLKVLCFLQGKERETCLLSDTQLDDTGPLILFLIDFSTLRFVFMFSFSKSLFRRGIKSGFSPAVFMVCVASM